ncbi:hypothetical protein BT93_L5156 [Corymbia citriodora subsp. variegata]|uniref:Golgi apparatus membrane protein TVP38 n=1 Tax=Corymbia citriodora subsp. variegata TaxID=360336 RepID=A0A8T0CJ47_CORYI|nr:hypothetical protein BT93_L5156 [Corymbia citriodora subsp. variegata]
MPRSSEPYEDSPTSSLHQPHIVPRRSLSSGRASPHEVRQSRFSGYRDEALYTVDKLQRHALTTYHRLSPLQRILAALALVAAGVLGILFLVFSERIFDVLEPVAEKWKHTTGGWTILWAITFVTAFPPVIGYSTCGTIAGFVYGVAEGWLIYASATITGSFCSFIVSRTILRKYVERLVKEDKRFAALTLTLKEDGLKLLCMIRLCPLPYSLSNGAMATIPTVQPSQYALATAIITPKLFIPVFIGSRLSAIARKKGQMSRSTKLLNWASILVFAVFGACVGFLIYRKTMRRAEQLEQEEAATVRSAERTTGRPPQQFMDDPELRAAAVTLAQDDDIAYFDEEDAQSYRDDEENAFGRHGTT